MKHFCRFVGVLGLMASAEQIYLFLGMKIVLKILFYFYLKNCAHLMGMIIIQFVLVFGMSKIILILFQIYMKLRKSVELKNN